MICEYMCELGCPVDDERFYEAEEVYLINSAY